MADVIKRFEEIYNIKGESPWTFESPSPELVNLVECGKINGLTVLEIGSGEGINSIYLASKGFKVSAFDRSQKAIEFAKQNLVSAKVNLDFFTMDYKDLSQIVGKFDFIFDWRFLHEITDEYERLKYAKNIARLLSNEGKYLSVAFSGNEECLVKGKLRAAPSGMTVYFATLEDTEKLFSADFVCLEKKLIKVPQNPDLQITANYLFMGRM